MKKINLDHKYFNFELERFKLEMEVKNARRCGNQVMEKALIKELTGYSRVDMSKQDIINERDMMNRMYSLGFMEKITDE